MFDFIDIDLWTFVRRHRPAHLPELVSYPSVSWTLDSLSSSSSCSQSIGWLLSISHVRRPTICVRCHLWQEVSPLLLSFPLLKFFHVLLAPMKNRAVTFAVCLSVGVSSNDRIIAGFQSGLVELGCMPVGSNQHHLLESG